MLIDKLRCIFVHVPKTAGTSLTRFIGMGDVKHNQHWDLQQYLHHFGRAKFDSYFKFGFIRNPWEGMVSKYHFVKGSHLPNQKMRQSWLRSPSFRSWILNEEVLNDYRWMTTDQLNYFMIDGEMRVDFVGRFENLELDVKKVCSILGVNTDVESSICPKCGKVHLLGHELPSKHKPYQTYYDQTTRDVVARRFARDVEMFGYSFD